MRKDLENTEENSEKIGKIWKKIVKWFGKHVRKVNSIVKWYWKYRRKLWNDMENTEENSEKFRKYGRKISWIVVIYGN